MGLLDWFRKKHRPPPTEVSRSSSQIAHQEPGEVFPWPKEWRLTALDEAVLAVPTALLADHETIGSVIHADNDVQLQLSAASDPGADNRILIWLQAGQSVWLTKSCQAMVVPS
jgi:hypothetical protein